MEIQSVRPLPKSPVKKKVNGILFEFDFDYDPTVKAMYHGTYELSTVAAMQTFLKRGDTFIDVGANIGYLSVIALGLVGKEGQVHSFEPVPAYCEKLRRVAQENREYRLAVNQCALGEKEGTAEIAVTRLANIGWNTMVPSFMDEQARKETLTIDVYRLDKCIG